MELLALEDMIPWFAETRRFGKIPSGLVSEHYGN